MSPKLIVILGPTSSGKSSLAIKLAKKFNGEIISADSRQVYRGMDLGTGKVPISYGLRSKTSTKSSIPAKAGIYSGGIRHHLLDVVSPKKQFTVQDFKQMTNLTIVKIVSMGKIPFLVGGTPFYIYAVIDDLAIPEVAPNIKLRNQLRNKTAPQLFSMLKKLDPRRAGNIDRQNPRRLIRAIEIIQATGQPVPALSPLTSHLSPLILGIKKDLPQLYRLIDRRLNQRLKAGMVAEVKRLIKQGVSRRRLLEMGLEYRYVSKYIFKYISYDQMRKELKQAIHKFAKRQMTWFKTDSRIHWTKNQKEAEKLIKNYLK